MDCIIRAVELMELAAITSSKVRTRMDEFRSRLKPVRLAGLVSAMYPPTFSEMAWSGDNPSLKFADVSLTAVEVMVRNVLPSPSAEEGRSFSCIRSLRDSSTFTLNRWPSTLETSPPVSVYIVIALSEGVFSRLSWVTFSESTLIGSSNSMEREPFSILKRLNAVSVGLVVSGVIELIRKALSLEVFENRLPSTSCRDEEKERERVEGKERGELDFSILRSDEVSCTTNSAPLGLRE